MNKAFEDVMAERRRQIEAEGFDTAHDDGHGEGDLALAGACYARYVGTCSPFGYTGISAPKDWPWSPKWFKPTTPRRDLVKAAALILAEIERLDRATAQTVSEPVTAVRCSECGWIGESTDLGAEGECGGEGCPGTSVNEIADPAAMIRAWHDSDGHYCGKQLADAGYIAPRPATVNEAGALDMEPGATVWDLTAVGEAALNAAKAEG
ncbi:hypothetical protein [Azospirillum palustre]